MRISLANPPAANPLQNRNQAARLPQPQVRGPRVDMLVPQRPTDDLFEANAWYPGNASQTFGNQSSCVCWRDRCREVALVRSPKGFDYALRACKPAQINVVQRALGEACHATRVGSGVASDWPVVGFVTNMDVAAQNLSVLAKQDAAFYGCMRGTLDADPFSHSQREMTAEAVKLSALLLLGLGTFMVGGSLLIKWCRSIDFNDASNWVREDQDFRNERRPLLAANRAEATGHGDAASIDASEATDDEAEEQTLCPPLSPAAVAMNRATRV